MAGKEGERERERTHSFTPGEGGGGGGTSSAPLLLLLHQFLRCGPRSLFALCAGKTLIAAELFVRFCIRGADLPATGAAALADLAGERAQARSHKAGHVIS